LANPAKNARKVFTDHFANKWPVNPADYEIWGKFGICDDGITGTGKWLWQDKDLEPELFWESESHETLEQEEEDITWVFFILILVMFWSLLMLYAYNQLPILEKFPEWIAAVILGVIIGVLFRLYHSEYGLGDILKFEPHTYFLLLLPPIMFQAGFSMNASTFFRNLVPINAFSVLGTLIASGLFTALIFYAAKYTTLSLNFLDSLQLGWIMSAIDPVATISIFKSLSINDRIYLIIFGESTLNNAVAIALVHSIEGIKQMVREGYEPEIADIAVFSIEKFCVYFCASFIIGAVWAMFISLLFAYLHFDEYPWIEIAFFTLSSYFPYLFCESIGCSGILSIFTWGIILRNYAFYSLSPYGKITIEYWVDTLGFTTENFVFAYLGISIALWFKSVNINHVLIGIVVLLVTRTISVFLVSWLLNKCRKRKIPFSHQLIFSYAALRGAVSFYLALNITSEHK
jgi:sodium/hydrogen exchanger 8